MLFSRNFSIRLLTLSAIALLSSAQAMAMESTLTANNEVPLSFHVGAGATIMNTKEIPVFDFELGVGITRSFSLRARANMFMIPKKYTAGFNGMPEVITGGNEFCFGIIPSFGVRREHVSVNLGPYVGAMGDRILVGAAGTLLIHFGSGIGLAFSPLFFTDVGKSGTTVVTMTGGFGIEM